jgi:hypothetical protein
MALIPRVRQLCLVHLLDTLLQRPLSRLWRRSKKVPNEAPRPMVSHING